MDTTTDTMPSHISVTRSGEFFMRSMPFVLASLAYAVKASVREGVDTFAAQRIKGEALNRSKVMETAFYLTDCCLSH